MASYRFFSREKGWYGENIIEAKHFITKEITCNLIEKYNLQGLSGEKILSILKKKKINDTNNTYELINLCKLNSSWFLYESTTRITTSLCADGENI